MTRWANGLPEYPVWKDVTIRRLLNHSQANLPNRDANVRIGPLGHELMFACQQSQAIPRPSENARVVAKTRVNGGGRGTVIQLSPLLALLSRPACLQSGAGWRAVGPKCSGLGPATDV